jgi:hypothetical protein
MRVNEIADTLRTIAAICDPSQLEVLHFAPSLDDCSLVLRREKSTGTDGQ